MAVKKSKRPRQVKDLRGVVLEELLEAERAPAELAKKVGLSLEELSTLGRDNHIVETLRGLVELAEIRAQVLLSRFRAHAAMHLIAIASADEPSELARKACVDLLKMDLDHLQPPDHPNHPNHPNHPDQGAGSSSEDAPPAPNEDAILRALEALGAAGEERAGGRGK